ncbi:MAG TPA: aminotransferase class V-fold PLP-dependent enzyme [Thermoanaerobaculia bacterium]|jgi:kynureninase|nr:aminotransferase class V-fold PLP-dependent enzyme [Thermoanaerobaculia bacterium]
MSFDRRREEFPSLSAGIHLLSHSLGPMPRGARGAMDAYLGRWEGYTRENAWKEEWWDLSFEVGDRIARLLGAAPGSVQPQPNASVALSVVASCFDFSKGPRRKVVTTGLEFPTTEYVWREQERAGARLHVVESEDGVATPFEKLLDAIDEDTALVSLSHVSYRSSHRIDPRPVVERARRVGALVLLDVYQSAGVLPLDVAAWGVDFAVGGTIKWLCGGPACGYLYARPDLAGTLRPRLTGWIAHEEPFDFAPGPIRYASGPRRFAQGTPGVPGLYSCLPGLKIIEDVGAAAIEAESRRRTHRMVEFALDRGWPLKSPADSDERGGSVMIGASNPEKLEGELARRRVFVDWRPGVIRMSPHFFNNDDEVEEALLILARLIGI